MILTLIGICILILAVIGACIAHYIFKHSCDTTNKLYYKNIDEICEIFSEINFVIGGILTFVCIIAIIFAHTGVEVRLQKQQIQYDTLCNEYNMIKNEIETSDKVRASYAQIMDNIAEWNKDTISDRYWAKNLWTNWFYNQKIVKARKLIEIE